MRPEFIPGKRYYLLFADKKGFPYLREIEDKLIENSLSFELIFNEGEEVSIAKRLSGQRMGCYVYAAGHSDMIERLDRIAKDVGFSGEEMQLMPCSWDRKNVFCSRCHRLQETQDQQITCEHCGLQLTVSGHYSLYHGAFLGYPGGDGH